MLIRKRFTFDGMHIVRDCSSERCKKSLHSHTYVVEVKLDSSYVDHGQMVVDFGLLKGTVKDIIMSWHKTYALWNLEAPEFKSLIDNNFTRKIIMPVSPSAEMLSLMFYAIIKRVLEKTLFNNGERNIALRSVVVHETTSGYAESFASDYHNIWEPNFSLDQIVISDEIKAEWKDSKMWDKITNKDSNLFVMQPIKPQYPHQLINKANNRPTTMNSIEIDPTKGWRFEDLPKEIQEQATVSMSFDPQS